MDARTELTTELATLGHDRAVAKLEAEKAALDEAINLVRAALGISADAAGPALADQGRAVGVGTTRAASPDDAPARAQAEITDDLVTWEAGGWRYRLSREGARWRFSGEMNYLDPLHTIRSDFGLLPGGAFVAVQQLVRFRETARPFMAPLERYWGPADTPDEATDVSHTEDSSSPEATYAGTLCWDGQPHARSRYTRPGQCFRCGARLKKGQAHA